MTTTWSSTWKCPDCGIAQPITPGQDTRPLAAAHECDSTTLAIHQAGIAGWVDGYRFALEHHDEPTARRIRAAVDDATTQCDQMISMQGYDAVRCERDTGHGGMHWSNADLTASTPTTTEGAAS
jgi:hypothetical protein